jgi:hypothetical protein
MDVVGSEDLIFCLDQDALVESSIPPDIKRKAIREGRALYQKSKTSREYKEYRS